MADDEKSAVAPSDAWRAFVAGLGEAGERLARRTEKLSREEQADGFRALVRALHNQLGRFEVDRERPELVPFNGWRQKFFMDNPDFLYWVADIRPDRRYRVFGTRGGAAFLSLTAYAASGLVEASAAARLDSDSLAFDAAGRFSVTLSAERPAAGDWLELPRAANAVWVRQFYDDVRHGVLGTCSIEPLDGGPPPPFIEPDRFARHLARLGPALASVANVLGAVERDEKPRANQVRHWSEMQGGAAFTEPGIHYVRGAWELSPDEALVLEGEAVPARYWNVLLYSRFLNSLDYRHRTVSLTGSRIPLRNGRYRVVLAARDPGVPGWLDTEGRPFGLFVLRWLKPERMPELPKLRVLRRDEVAREP
jgi:hypothetical protein